MIKFYFQQIETTQQILEMYKDREYIYENLTRTLIGCFFDIHNSLGVGYNEKAYHKDLKRLFQKTGIENQSKERKSLIHRGFKVKECEAILVVFGKIILELKTIQSNFLQANFGRNEFQIQVIRV